MLQVRLFWFVCFLGILLVFWLPFRLFLVLIGSLNPLKNPSEMMSPPLKTLPTPFEVSEYPVLEFNSSSYQIFGFKLPSVEKKITKTAERP